MPDPQNYKLLGVVVAVKGPQPHGLGGTVGAGRTGRCWGCVVALYEMSS